MTKKLHEDLIHTHRKKKKNIGETVEAEQTQ